MKRQGVFTSRFYLKSKKISSAASSTPIGPVAYLALGDGSSSAGALAAFSGVQVDDDVSGVLADLVVVGSSIVTAGDHLAMFAFLRGQTVNEVLDFSVGLLRISFASCGLHLCKQGWFCLR